MTVASILIGFAVGVLFGFFLKDEGLMNAFKPRPKPTQKQVLTDEEIKRRIDRMVSEIVAKRMMEDEKNVNN